MQSGTFGMREIGGGPQGERTVRVRFTGAHDGRQHAARQRKPRGWGISLRAVQ